MSHANASAHWIPATLSLLVAAVVGCGLSDLTEGAFSGNGTEGTGGSGGVSSTTTTGTTTGTTTSTTGTTTSTGQGGAPTTVTTTTTGQPGGMLDCGNSVTCPQGADNACCWDGFSDSGMCIQGPPDPATCNTNPTNGGFDTRIECQLPSHCDPGLICCGDIENPGGFQYYPTVTCQATCSWPGNRVMCDPQNPVCPVVTTGNGSMVQTVCEQSGILPAGYFICRLP